ncbi:MAG TPA: MgtC/SapB family protein [Clostridiales bacterium]|jgi:putative Mg2+ transporter-C (MgtC) family protein|nr:MgtC/SapB family protein [Clostridiales bacterium]
MRYLRLIDLQSINNITIVLRLVMAVILGGIIGFERGRAGRPAGLRTHILVCLGSTLTIMTNQYIFQEMGAGDPTRMAAQVISGIGFLGAGTIIVTGRHQVKGLTTAAGLWATACMGIAIGIGFYTGALVGCFLIAFSTVVLHRLDNYMLSKSKVMDMYIEFNTNTSINTIIDKLKEQEIKIDSLEIVKPTYGASSVVAAILTLRLKQKRNRYDVVADICSLEGVEYAEEV